MQGEKGIGQAGTTAGNDFAQLNGHFFQLRLVGHFQPFALRAGQRGAGLCVEFDHLVLAAHGQLRGQPVHRIERTVPFLRTPLDRRVHIAQANDVYQFVGQHTGGDIQQDGDVTPAQVQTRQVLAIALAHESAGAGAAVFLGGLPQFFHLFFQGLDFSLEGVDVGAIGIAIAFQVFD